MSNFDEGLKKLLEERMGRIIEDRISTIHNLSPQSLDNISDELVQVMCRSKEMSELKSKLFNSDSEILTIENESFVPYDVILNHSAARTRNTVSKCSSANVSPRIDKTEDCCLPTAERRRRHHSAGQRMQALELLLKVPVSDIVSSANWPQLQQELCESLRDDNWLVFEQVLKVLCRLSSSKSFNSVREGFLSLLEGLTLYYLTRHLHQQLPSALHGIQLESPVHRRIILLSQCLLQVLNEVPGKWIRYGEKRTQEIIDNFVDLLSMHTHHHRSLTVDQSKDILYPFHIFSTLDPEAKWCVGVMHAAFGRSVLIKSIMKSASLIRFIVEEVIIWLKAQLKVSECVTVLYEYGNNGNVNNNTINLTIFLHCISLIQLFVSCDRGHLIFPVLTSIQEEAISVYYLLLKFLEFLNKISNEPKTLHSKRLVKVLENVCASLILSKGSRILHGTSIELIQLLLETPAKSDQLNTLHVHNINILCKISESATAVRWMLGRPVRKTREGLSRAFSELRMSMSSASSSGRESVLTSRAGSIAKKIAKATTNAVNNGNKFMFEAASSLCQLLALSEKLFSSPEGYLILESCEGQLIPQTGYFFIHLSSMIYETDLGLLAVQQGCEKFLVSITLTPMGFSAISGVEGLLKCILKFHMESPNIAKFNDPRFLHLLKVSTSIPDNKLNVYLKSIMKHAFGQLWAIQETKSEWMWLEAKCHFITLILSICSTPTVLSEMLEDSDHGDGSSVSTLVEETEPHTLMELFDRGLEAMEVCPPFLQEIALDVLHALAHNIDFIFVLQDKIKLMECLQRLLHDSMQREYCNGSNLLPSPRRDKMSVTDNTSYSCSHILSIMSQLRDTSCNPLPWPRSPRSPRTHAHTSRPRVQTDLQRFLQDTRHGLHDTMWISHARRAYRASCRSELKISILVDLLDQLLQSQPSVTLLESPLRWPTSVIHSPHSPQHVQAIETIIRYGCQIKVLNTNMMNQLIEQLSLFLHHTKVFVGHQSAEHCFDWFASSVFLMCGGNLERSRSVLQRVAMLPTGVLIWPLLSSNTLQLTASINQHLQGLLAEYVPTAYNVLLEAGVPWWTVAEQLSHQAFLPIISVSQLSHVIALTALHSWEYNLYLHTAILAHIQPALVDISPHHSILSLLAELRLENFLVGDYVPFMDKLAKLNRPYLVRDRIATATL